MLHKMTMSITKTHWENIYNTKTIDNVSWFEEDPKTSFKLIKKTKISLEDEIIDIGSGKSYLIDNLLKNKYTSVNILDISNNAINEVKLRIQNHYNQGVFYNCNILDFKPSKMFDLWHDRAVFHFLKEKSEINKYIYLVSNYIKKDRYFILGVFSENGPLKCSGLEIKRYSVEELKELFVNNFLLIDSINVDHCTPFNTTQNFNFCIFKKFN